MLLKVEVEGEVVLEVGEVLLEVEVEVLLEVEAQVLQAQVLQVQVKVEGEV